MSDTRSGINSAAKAGLVFVPVLVGLHLFWEFSYQNLDVVDGGDLLVASDSLRNKKRKFYPANLFNETMASREIIHDMNSFTARKQFATTLSQAMINDVLDTNRDIAKPEQRFSEHSEKPPTIKKGGEDTQHLKNASIKIKSSANLTQSTK